MAYQDRIKDRAIELRGKHQGESFNVAFVPSAQLKKIANRFTSHKPTDIEGIKSIKRVVHYMIAAKMVGDKKLYEQLDDYSGHILDSFCKDIEIADNCYDDFDSALDRHLYRANPQVYEYLKNNHIAYADAGLVRDLGKDIYLPQYEAIICVLGNSRCINEITEYIRRTPEKDKHKDEEFNLNLLASSLNQFTVYDGKLHVTDVDSDRVDVDESTPVIEVLLDFNADVEAVYESMLSFKVSKKDTPINLFKKSNLASVKNGSVVIINNALIYHDEDRHMYKLHTNGDTKFIVPHFYHDLNKCSLVYSYVGAKNGKFVEQVKFSSVGTPESMKYDQWKVNITGTDKMDKDADLVYLCYNSTIKGSLSIENASDFNSLANFLDSILDKEDGRR